jgi:hypothetical protein
MKQKGIAEFKHWTKFTGILAILFGLPLIVGIISILFFGTGAFAITFLCSLACEVLYLAVTSPEEKEDKEFVQKT